MFENRSPFSLPDADRDQERARELASFQQQVQLEAGWPSGIHRDVRNRVFGDSILNETPFRDLKSPEAVMERTAKVVFDSLSDVQSRDWLVIWNTQYGMIETTRYIANYLAHFTVDETKQRAHKLLTELDQAQAHLESLHRIEPAGRDSSIRSQDGQSVTAGELYIFGVRESLRYAIKLLDMVQNGAFNTQPNNEFRVPASMSAFGVFADSQERFVKNVLPRLDKIFEDRPNSIKIPYKKPDAQD
jgi:hypothetical protein